MAQNVMELDLNAEKAPSATLGVGVGGGGGPITLDATREESNQQILVRIVETCVFCIQALCINVPPLKLRSHENAV